MMNINKILVATDFSENAVPAYIHAQEIARNHGAMVDFIHVIPTLKYFNESLSRLGMPLDMGDDFYPTLQKEATHRLQELMQDYIKEEYKGDPIAKIDRKASSAIVEVAAKGDYDLIVIASKGGHASTYLRGSTTEKVIRHSPIPVFTVDKGLEGEGLRRILVPTDGSVVSMAAFPMALTMARAYNAEITLFHVMTQHGELLDDEGFNEQQSDEMNTYEALMRTLEKYLMKDGRSEVELLRGKVDYEDQIVLTDGASSFTVNLHTVLEKGTSVGENIRKHAVEHSDLVVMATHGHGGMAHFFLGSTTERVVRHLDMPVLAVKPDKEKLQQ